MDRLISYVLTLCAVVVAGSVGYRTFSGGNTSERSPHAVAHWDQLSKEAASIGYRMGDSTAPVTIVELADLQCPACAGFHPKLKAILKELPHTVSALYVPYPMSYHKQAKPAAYAADCAFRAGRFSEWVDAIYTKQDSLGTKPWEDFAREAGIRDTKGIAQCANDTTRLRRIDAGLAFGEKVGLAGTPTIIIDGYMVPGAMTVDRLRKVIQDVSAGKHPFRRWPWSQL